MIDTHAHIYANKFSEDREQMLERAFATGVEKIYMPNIDLDSIDSMHQLADQYGGRCIPMMGLHPCHVDHNYERVLEALLPWFEKRQYCAVGEIGTDLYWDKSLFELQQSAFRIQCNWAITYDLPIVIHCRDSFWETVSLIKEFPEGALRGIFHCFTGGIEEANAAIELGFRLGIGGVVTFKNGGLDKVLPSVDLGHIVLETDCPYLAPVPHRGKRNEPSYLQLIAQRLAEIKQVSLAEVVKKTSENARQTFGL